MSPRRSIDPVVLTLRTLVVLVLAVLIGLGTYTALSALPGDVVGVESVEHGAEGGGGQGGGGGRGLGRGAGQGGGRGEGRYAVSPQEAALRSAKDFVTIGAWVLLAVLVEIGLMGLIRRRSAAQRASVQPTPTSPGA